MQVDLLLDPLAELFQGQVELGLVAVQTYLG
jgi:hypothetical protein